MSGRRRRILVAWGATLLLGAARPSVTHGQSSLGRVDDRRRGELLRELRTLDVVEERTPTSAGQGRPAPGTRTQAAMLQGERLRRVEALLDTLVLQRPAGALELAVLERAYPKSLLLRRTRADLELRDGRPQSALAAYDALLRYAPLDAAIARRRARALAALHDTARALQAWSAALDAQPEDREAFDSLLAWRAATGTLSVLESQLERLQRSSADSLLLDNRRAEVVERRGRMGGTP